MRREIAEGCHVPGRTVRGFKTPRRSAERRCRVPLFPGDPGNTPRLVDYAPFGASLPRFLSGGGTLNLPLTQMQFAGSDDARPDGADHAKQHRAKSMGCWI